MNTVLIFVSICCFSMMSVAIRLYQLRVPGQEKGMELFQAVLNGSSGVLFFFGSGLGLRMSGGLWWMAVLFGAFAYVSSICYALSMEKGPLSLSSILLSMSLIWPLLYSAIGNHEKFTTLQIVGVTLILVTLALSAACPGTAHRRATVLWLVVALAAFFANGITATQQKMTVIGYGEKEAMQMMGVGYLFSAMLFLLHHLVKAARATEGGAAGIRGFSVRDTLLTFGLSLGAGVTSFLGNLINGGLCARVPGAVLYPCVNGGLCLMTSLVSFLFFGEKLTWLKALAMVSGITAIVLLNL